MKNRPKSKEKKDFDRTCLYIWITWRVSYEKQELLTLREHLSSPSVYDGVRVAHLWSFLCCTIMCLYVLSSVLWCPLRFPHKNDVRFVFTSSCLQEGSCLIYVICVCLCIGVYNTYCVVFLLCLSSSCVLCTQCCQFPWIVHSWLPLRFI